jgi:integrase
MNLLHFPPNADESTPPASESAAPEWQEVTRALLDRFYHTRCVARGLTPTSIHDRRRVVERFLTFCGCPPWQVTPYHYDAWISGLVRDNHIAVTTQRAYQSALENCFRYWQSDMTCRNHLLRTHGATVQCPISDDNRIIHKNPHQRIRRKTAPTREHIEALFDAMAELRDAYWRDPATEERGWCVERDRAAFAIQYYLALRIGEIVALDLESFHDASWAPPELGRFGVADVFGKGSAGQGPKQRTVMVTDVQVRVLMEWYLAHVRPHFNPSPDEHALFTTRAGKRLGRSYYVHRFRRYLRLAGLDSLGYTTHSLRGAGLSHMADRVSIQFAQQQGGHVFLATTEDYVSVSDDEIRAQHRDMVNCSLSRIAIGTRRRLTTGTDVTTV